MTIRSLLFVPADRPERMEKALTCGADALILDLEDAVAESAKPTARRAVESFLATHVGGPTKLLVRVNPLGSEHIAADLDAIAKGRPAGLLMPKAEGSTSVLALAAQMGARSIAARILPIATETPAALFQLGSYAAVAPLLLGLTWGAEDLPAAIGATTSREADGRYTPPYELARSLTLFGAHAAGVLAIETVFPAFRDLDGLAAFAAKGHRDGFSGMMAIHPAQVKVINAAFTARPEDLVRARAVIAAFEAQPGAGAVQLEGSMIDAPHLRQARSLLAGHGETR